MEWETARPLVLGVHVASGSLGLLLAWPVLLARKRRGLHTVGGRCYAGLLVVMCASALVLVAAEPRRLLGLGVIAVLTAAAGVGGVVIARRRPRLPGGWRLWHLQLMGTSVIAFVTAFAVTALDGGLVGWVLPTVVGSPLLGRTAAREARRRPRRHTAAPAR